ncbi:Retrovirus-related Pol polyprotein from transposon TNT 1-94 [Cardamine amara subsp. amara]|uniref:Retrovirus-related Pol polyprotein from transposon TNT 1-94 n=1 Tax=Cardamine amara subsp. amara TaxID=228776 RepID=A0ABD1ACK4_CARAN
MSLRRSTREKENAISDDYVVFLQEHENGIGLTSNDPLSVCEAIQSVNSDNWNDAMKEEHKSMMDNGFWDLVPLPENVKPIGCKWIFKTKRDVNGN